MLEPIEMFAAPGTAIGASRPLVVTLRGTVGQLTLGKSTEAQVIANLGAPEATGSGSFGAPAAPHYNGLGYECSLARRRDLRSPGTEGPPYCRTVYYVDGANGVLGGLWTTSTRYKTARGTRVGMAQHTASARERKPATRDCKSGITEVSHSTLLYLVILGGHITQPPRPRSEPYRLVGGNVTELLVEQGMALPWACCSVDRRRDHELPGEPARARG